MKNQLPFLALLALALAPGCVNRKAQEMAKATQDVVADPDVAVAVGKVSTRTVESTFELTGNLTTATDAQVSARQFGRLNAVYVSDGDAVKAGQILAELDAIPLRAQYQQALAQQQNAQAGLSTAIGNLRYGPLKSAAAVRQARAALASAQATLQKALTGARPEERAQAEANLNAAKTNLDLSKTDLERKQALVKEGALAKVNLDQAQNAYAAALQQYNNALQAQLMLARGNREEDIAVAREAVAQAQDAITNALAAQKLDVLYTDAVNSARAQLDAAKAQVRLARSNLDDAIIRAPWDGRVSGRPIQSGTILQPGTSILRLVGGQGAYFEGQVPQEHLDETPVGTVVTVRVDGIDGRTFQGRVAAVNPVGSEIGRLFKARIVLAGDLNGLSPNMFAHGIVVSKRIPNATVVPPTAIVARGQESIVYTLVGNKAHAVPVKVGLRLDDAVQVTGVDPGTNIVIQGQENLEEGASVKVKPVPGVVASVDSGLGKGS
jgi:HlyD family secretion protein